MTPQELINHFHRLDSWEDRYAYLMELGAQLAPLPDQYHQDDYLIPGCASRVWFYPYLKENCFYFLADSDSHIVKGLLKALEIFYVGHQLDECARSDIDSFLQQLGLTEHLSPTRRNGLMSIVQRIKHFTKPAKKGTMHAPEGS